MISLPVPRTVFAAFILLVLTSSIFVLGALGSDMEDIALSAISRAESTMGSAYESVLKAERAGANVSGLLNRLNDGVQALSKALMSYTVDDFNDAILSADLCHDSVVGIQGEAGELRELAVAESDRRLLLTHGASILGSGLAVLGGVLSWRLFKRWYYRRVLRMKPVVVNDES